MRHVKYLDVRVPNIRNFRYADRAKRIKIQLKKNVSGGNSSAELQLAVAHYAKTTEELKARVAALEEENAKLKEQVGLLGSLHLCAQAFMHVMPTFLGTTNVLRQ